MQAPPPILEDFPPELISAVAREASESADRVVIFLKALGLKLETNQPDHVLYLPREFLLGLDAALHLLIWEHRGIDIHRKAGLPSAMEALKRVFGVLSAPDSSDPIIENLGVRVLQLFAEQIAWHGSSELGADIVLGELDEDELVDALADVLWEHRHSLGAD